MITPMEELSRRNDAYINNMLLQKSKYSKEYLLAATMIFEERGLADPKKQELISRYPLLKSEVSQKYAAGISAEHLNKYLTHEGMTVQDANEMIKNVTKKNLMELKDDTSAQRNIVIIAIIAVVLIGFAIRFFTN